MNYSKGEWKFGRPVNNDYTGYTGEYGEGTTSSFSLPQNLPKGGHITMATKCTCQTKNGRGVRLGCQNCIDGSVCSEMYEACKLALKLANAIVEQVSGNNVEVLMARATIAKALAKAEGRECDNL